MELVACAFDVCLCERFVRRIHQPLGLARPLFLRGCAEGASSQIALGKAPKNAFGNALCFVERAIVERPRELRLERPSRVLACPRNLARQVPYARVGRSAQSGVVAETRRFVDLTGGERGSCEQDEDLGRRGAFCAGEECSRLTALSATRRRERQQQAHVGRRERLPRDALAELECLAIGREVIDEQRQESARRRFRPGGSIEGAGQGRASELVVVLLERTGALQEQIVDRRNRARRLGVWSSRSRRTGLSRSTVLARHSGRKLGAEVGVCCGRRAWPVMPRPGSVTKRPASPSCSPARSVDRRGAMAARKTTKTTPKLVIAGPRRKRSASHPQVAAATLRALIEEAVVDAHDDEEQRMGFLTMLQDNVDVPFETEVLGVLVEVTEIGTNDAEEIVAVCKHGRHVQRVSVVDLPLPKLPPEGFEWIEAYRLFASRGG